MNMVATTRRDPLVVLDAAALLPSEVDTEGPSNRFTSITVNLLDALTSRLVSADELRSSLESLADVAGAFVDVLDIEPPSSEASAEATARCSVGLRPNEIDERIRYDEFFGIRRVDGLDARELASTTFLCLRDTLADLAQTQLGVHELVALLRGIVLITEWIDVSPSDEVRVARSEQATNDEAALSRFRLGHLVFALACNFGYHHLRRASAQQTEGETLIRHLEAAATCVRASTAAMWYSTSFPQNIYSSAVRPLMDAASTKDHGFSGLDNFDFRRMRESWEDLPALLSSRLAESDGQTRLRAATHRLYEVIMEDNEHHILIAAEALGIAPSLKSERMADTATGVSGIPAVAALRLNAEERRALLDTVASLQ